MSKLCYNYDMPEELCRIICDYARPIGFCKSPMGQAITNLYNKVKDEWTTLKAEEEAIREDSEAHEIGVIMSSNDYHLCINNYTKRFNKMTLDEVILWGTIPEYNTYHIWLFELGLLNDLKKQQL